MKTNRLLAAMLLPVLFACTKEDDSVKNPNSGEKFDFTITVSEDPSSITKASFDDAKGIYWTAGRKAGIVNSAGEKTESAQLSNIYENGQKASFVFSETNTGEYKFFYPYHSEANNKTIPFWVDPNQSTSAGNSADCFAVVSTELVTLDATNHDTPAETHYKVVGSYIRFAPFGKAGEKVKYIITRGESSTVSGRYFVNWDNSFDHYDLNAETVTLTVNGDYTTVAAKEDAKGLYAAVLPANSQNTYTVVTEKGYYVFSASAKEFKFGAIKDIPLNLEKASRRTPDQLYLVGDATTAGWNGNDAIELTKKSGENKFVAEGIVLVPAKEGFKFNTKKSASDDAWTNAFVNDGDNKLAYYVNIPPDKDKKFTVDTPGKYNLTVDFDTFTVTAQLVEELIPTVMNGTDNPKQVTMEKLSDGVYSGVLYVGSGDQNHDILIKMGDNYYYEGSDYTQVVLSNSESEYNSKEAVRSHSDKKGWWLNDGNNATERYYKITLDLKKNSVKIRFAQGKKYWLNGDFCGWGKSNAIQAEANDNGIVSWTKDVNSEGAFKICGEYTLESIPGKSEWDGEWYFSNATDDVFNLSWETGNNYNTSLPVYPFYPGADKKWRLSESGTYTIEFDTVNLKLKVTKQ